jgi:hypothetical protein
MEITNFENYILYEDGSVWGKKRKKFLKPFKRSDGYMSYCLRNIHGQKGMKIHRLLATHYIPNIENKPCVDHINRIRDDNRLCNLRWATYSEN